MGRGIFREQFSLNIKFNKNKKCTSIRIHPNIEGGGGSDFYGNFSMVPWEQSTKVKALRRLSMLMQPQWIEKLFEGGVSFS